MLKFEYPFLFFLLVPAMAVLWLYWRKTEGRSREVRWVTILRGLLFATIITALAVPSLVLPAHEKKVVFLIDRSESIAEREEAMRDWIEQAISAKGIEDEYAIVSFAADAVVEKPLGSSRTPFSPGEVIAGDTSYENALVLASTLLKGQSGRIVLLSDGNETRGDGERISRVLAGQGIEIDHVLFEPSVKPDMAIERFSVSELAYEGEWLPLTLHVRSTFNGDAVIVITANDREIVRESVRVQKGEQIFEFPYQLKEQGLISFHAEIMNPEDSFIENNRLYAVSRIRQAPKLLLVENEPSLLDQVLRNAGLSFDPVSGERLFTTLRELLNYQAIIFNNVAATSIAAQQMELVEQAVRDFGAGFIMLGGEESFALGGYFQTPIERLLPVEMEIRAKEKIPTLGLVIVLDRSSSMEGRKLALAKEAAARSVDLLREDDIFGFIAFDDRPREIVPTGAIGDKGKVIKQIRSIASGGGTEIVTSLKLAYEQLGPQPVERKHIILLTDGQSPFLEKAFSFIEKGLTGGITLSTVAIGNDASRTLLEKMAEIGGGRFYNVRDETTIPTILSRETVVMTRTYIVNDPFYPKFLEGTDWAGLFPNGVKKINAYVATTPKSGSMVAMESDQGDPLLAEWHYGLGTTIAFTSDVTGTWSGEFSGMEEFPQFLLTMVSHVLPSTVETPFSTTVQGEGDWASITIKSETGGVLLPEIAIVSDQGEEVDTHIRLLSPGEYEIRIPKKAGLYFMNVHWTDEEGTGHSYETGFSLPYSGEFLQKGSNPARLAAISEASGATGLKKPKEAFRPLKNREEKRTPLSPGLLATAFFLAFIEFAVRRLGLSFFTGFYKKGEAGGIPQTDHGVTRILKKTGRNRGKKDSESEEKGKTLPSFVKAGQKGAYIPDISMEKKTPSASSGEKVRIESGRKDSANISAADREERLRRLLEAKKKRI